MRRNDTATILIALCAVLMMIAATAASSATVKTTMAYTMKPVERTSTGFGFWTPERMRQAVPKHIILEAPETRRGIKAEEEQVTACPGSKMQKWTSSSEYSRAPFPSVGKVFFTMGGDYYVCSASIGGDNMVWTAGHCVYDPDSSEWASEFTFVPQYFDGSAPYGAFDGSHLYTSNPWKKGDISADYALVRMSKTFPTNLGRLSLLTNQNPSNLTYVSYGYPAGEPFDGEFENTCSSTGCYRDSSTSPATVGISCDSTGGSSGGPWIRDAKHIVSVNSYGYNNKPDVMYGPYFDAATMTFFKGVATSAASSELTSEDSEGFVGHDVVLATN